MSQYDIVNDNDYFLNWFSGILEQTPDLELMEDRTLIKLRQSSKKLIKNNFIAAGAQLAYINSVVGGEVIVNILADNNKLQQQCRDTFDSFKNNVNLTRDQSVSQLMDMVVSTVFQDGDVLINLPVDSWSGKTYVELIEASRIQTPPTKHDNVRIRNGVEYYASGRLKGFWVLQDTDTRVTYYSATDDNFKFYPVYKSAGDITRRVCYLFKAPLNLRPNQSRQIPVITGCMGVLRYFNQYLEAVLIGARVAACFAGFVKTNNPVAAEKSLTEINSRGNKVLKLKPAMISYLRQNEDIVFGAPNRPSDNFDSFILRLCRFVAVVLRIPYEALFLDLSVTNFSAWRGGSLETERNVNRWRRDLTWVIRWIVLTILQEGLVNSQINGSLKDVTIDIKFPKNKSLDEEKTARARKIDLAIGVSSQQKIAEEAGDDFDTTQAQLDAEMEIRVMRDALRLKLQKELEARFGIVFDPIQQEGTDGDEIIDADDKHEQRKEDGNW